MKIVFKSAIVISALYALSTCGLTKTPDSRLNTEEPSADSHGSLLTLAADSAKSATKKASAVKTKDLDLPDFSSISKQLDEAQARQDKAEKSLANKRDDAVSKNLDIGQFESLIDQIDDNADILDHSITQFSGATDILEQSNNQLEHNNNAFIQSTDTMRVQQELLATNIGNLSSATQDFASANRQIGSDLSAVIRNLSQLRSAVNAYEDTVTQLKAAWQDLGTIKKNVGLAADKFKKAGTVLQGLIAKEKDAQKKKQLADDLDSIKLLESLADGIAKQLDDAYKAETKVIRTEEGILRDQKKLLAFLENNSSKQLEFVEQQSLKVSKIQAFIDSQKTLVAAEKDLLDQQSLQTTSIASFLVKQKALIAQQRATLADQIALLADIRRIADEMRGLLEDVFDLDFSPADCQGPLSLLNIPQISQRSDLPFTRPANMASSDVIGSQADFKNMRAGWAYRLSGNITLDKTYLPMALRDVVLDGAGFTITLPAKVNLLTTVDNSLITNLIVANGTVVAKLGSGVLAETVTNSSIFGVRVANSVLKGKLIAGGLAGTLKSSKVRQVCVAANVSGKGAVGGIAAQMDNSEFQNVVFAGHVIGKKSTKVPVNGVGGMAGVVVNSKMISSYSYVNLYSSIPAGGFIGKISGTSRLEDMTGEGYVKAKTGGKPVAADASTSTMILNSVFDGVMDGK